MSNSGKYLVGKLKDYDYGKGWFFGQFAKENLLRSDTVEIAYQKLDDIGISKNDYPHYHKEAVEINIVICGSCSFILNGHKYKVEKGSFYVIYPGAVIDAYQAEKNTEIVVIKSPSVKKDKFILQKQ